MTFNKLGLEHLKLILSIIFSLQKPKRRNILSLILFLFCSLNIFAQAEIDSLKQLYTLQISEFERGKTIYKNVFSNLIRENPNLAKEAANRNYEISKNTKNLEAIANAELNLSIVYFESSNYGVSLKYIYIALKGYEKIKTRQEALNDKEEVHNANSNIAKVYLTIAQIHYAMKSYKKAIEFCNKTIGLKEKMSEKDNLYYGVFLTRSNIASFLKDY
jgi:tetratricopeptide (TPR) repeat protein